MNSIAIWGMAIAASLAVLTCPQKSAANGFSGAEFVEWAVSSQDSYIETSVVMTAVVFAQAFPNHADCLNTWYFADGAQKQRNTEFREAIASHPKAHPSGVVLAVIYRACGNLN